MDAQKLSQKLENELCVILQKVFAEIAATETIQLVHKHYMRIKQMQKNQVAALERHIQNLLPSELSEKPKLEKHLAEEKKRNWARYEAENAFKKIPMEATPICDEFLAPMRTYFHTELLRIIRETETNGS